MKLFKLLLLIFFVFNAKLYSQESIGDSVQLSSLTADGILLDKGWRFKPGDNFDWSNPQLNDADWQPINPVKQLHRLPEVKKAGIGWFRLKIRVHPSLYNKTVAVDIRSIGATEFYMNGTKVHQFGVVSADFKNEKTHLVTNRQFSLELNSQPVQVLAVRYSFHPKNLYLNFGNIPFCLRLIVKEINKSYGDYFKVAGYYSILRSIQVSFYLPLGLLIFFLYISFRRRKEYLYFGSFCFFMFTGMIFQIIALINSATVGEANTYLLLANIFWITGQLYWLNGTYLLFGEKKTWIYRIILLYGWLIIPVYFLSNDFSDIFSASFSPLATFEFARLNVIAIRKKKPGAWIFMITSIVLFAVLITWIGFLFTDQYPVSALLLTTCFVIPAAGLSFFIAADFANTGSLLQARLAEVEELSKKMIANEKEKRQLLAEQNITLEKEVASRTSELKESIEELKATQAQLIQREKMASLGELTAGIAHEIQNPLNFVKNFSEVGTELIQEMEQELKNMPTDDARKLAIDIKEMLQKITFHSKRADAIVKGMLQHSRGTSGHKEFTDINALVDEYFMLSYHGLKAKNKMFNATTKSCYDPSITPLEIIPQDIARVLLNLFTNAFYSVNEKYKTAPAGYVPTVSVETKKLSNAVKIRINDNGLGVPQKILDKIFQPFFTTKPAGQGTGLGLSLSYDVVKAHGGTLEVHTEEGKYAEFVINLPQ